MATRMTARIPTTPETRKELRGLVDEREDVETYDDLIRSSLLGERED